jgi:hypothetical protein
LINSSGYIDIILKKKKDMGRVEREDDSIVPVEEMIAPIMAAPVMSITRFSLSLSISLFRSIYISLHPILRNNERIIHHFTAPLVWVEPKAVKVVKLS